MSKLFTASNVEFRNLLDGCSEADDLTILVGAGVSAEAGLPTWRELIKRYLDLAIQLRRQDSALDALGLDPDTGVAEFLIKTIPEAQRLATIGDMLVGASRRRAVLQLALYNRAMDFAPGPTSREIARLCEARSENGLRTHLVTTNFDDLLELAFVERGFDESTVRSLTLDDIPDDNLQPEEFIYESSCSRQEEDGAADVWHLHGCIPLRPEKEIQEPVLFAEREYALNYHFAIKSVSQLMSKGPCLFIGLSMADWDLVAAAHFVHESSADQGTFHFSLGLEVGDPQHEELFLRLQRARLGSMGLDSFKNLKSYAQIPQVIHELTNRTVQGDSYWRSSDRYGKRLDRWESDFMLRFPEDGDVLDAQVELSDHLAKELTDLKSALGLGATSDLVALHLWIRQRDEYKLYLWASSEYAHRTGHGPGYVEEIRENRFEAVTRAFLGTPTPGLRTVKRSRWRQVQAVPLIACEGERWWDRYGRLHAGVATISTNLPADQSQVSQALLDDSKMLDQLTLTLERIGKDLAFGWPFDRASRPD